MLSVGHTRQLICFLKNLDISPNFCHQLIDFKVPALGALASCPFSTAAEDPNKVSVRQKIQLSKTTISKVKRQPFAQNLFYGKVDTDLLAFPEVLDRKLLKDVENYVQVINELYKDKVDSHKISEEGIIPEDVLSELKEMGLFGRLVPFEYGGLNLSYTALVRLNEALSLDWSIFTTIAAHEFLAVQALLIAGNEEQKAKYLPDMASGKCVGALCWSEAGSGVDLNAICTAANQTTGKNFYSVTGTKHWVTNGNIADVFVVFVKMPKIRDEKEELVSVLLVDRNSEGISVSTENSKSGLRGTGTSTVTFTNVQVPHENIIGQIGDGPKILLKVLEVCQLGMASFTFGTLKELVGLAAEHLINTVRFEKPMVASQLLRQRLGKVATTIYAMESSAYFTAAVMDSTENPDCALECAILKVFNSEGTLFCLREMMKIFGCSSLLKGHILQRYYRDAEALESFEGTNDIARLFISLMGLHSVGQQKAGFVEQNRNRTFFPVEAVKTMWRQWRVMRSKSSYPQDVAGHLHPSLVVQANKLEECVQKLEILVEHVLTKHGKEVVHHQLDPVTLANVVIDLYATSAVLVRCSRSYCIGVQNSDPEVRLALAFCNDASSRIIQHYETLTEGFSENNDNHLIRTAEQLVNWRGYFAEHPLKYNF